MKRRDLVRHLVAHGGQLLREGGRHSILQSGEEHDFHRATPFRDVNEFLVRKICHDPGIPEP